MSTSSRALTTCPPGRVLGGPPVKRRAAVGRPPPWPADRSPAPRLVRAQIGPGATITYNLSSITPTFVCDGTLVEELKLELRRSQYRFAARVPGGTLWLRSAEDICCMTAPSDPPPMSHADRRRWRWAIGRQRQVSPAMESWISRPRSP